MFVFFLIALTANCGILILEFPRELLMSEVQYIRNKKHRLKSIRSGLTVFFFHSSVLQEGQGSGEAAKCEKVSLMLAGETPRPFLLTPAVFSSFLSLKAKNQSPCITL